MIEELADVNIAVNVLDFFAVEKVDNIGNERRIKVFRQLVVFCVRVEELDYFAHVGIAEKILKELHVAPFESQSKVFYVSIVKVVEQGFEMLAVYDPFVAESRRNCALRQIIGNYRSDVADV